MNNRYSGLKNVAECIQQFKEEKYTRLTNDFKKFLWKKKNNKEMLVFLYHKCWRLLVWKTNLVNWL